MKSKECPLCEEELVSELDRGCKMCGMPTNDEEFCSIKCEKMYKEIHKNDSIGGRK